MIIPRWFHCFWDGPEMPPEFVGYLERWRALHPDWELTLWTDTSYRDLMGDTRTLKFYAQPRIWSPKSNVWQWRADIARYELLNRFGGVWIDADLEPKRPIEPLIEDASCFIGRESPRAVNNAFMGCTPEHPFITDVLSGIQKRITGRRNERVNRSIGAMYLTELLAGHDDVLVIDRQMVYPYRWDQLNMKDNEFSGAYTVHHWNNQRKLRERRLGR